MVDIPGELEDTVFYIIYHCLIYPSASISLTYLPPSLPPSSPIFLPFYPHLSPLFSSQHVDTAVEKAIDLIDEAVGSKDGGHGHKVSTYTPMFT